MDHRYVILACEFVENENYCKSSAVVTRKPAFDRLCSSENLGDLPVAVTLRPSSQINEYPYLDCNEI